MEKINEALVDHELERIHRFQEQLAAVESVKIYESQFDFDNEEFPVDTLMSVFRTYELSSEPTLYLKPNLIDEPVQGPVYFMPRVARGSRQSGHHVFFGDLIFTDRHHISVAVKPHVEYATTSCLLDYYNAEAVSQLGLDGLTTVGFMTHEGQTAYSFTKLDRSLSTLDSIDWTDYFLNRDQNPGMTDIWQKVSRQLALVHSLGSLAHGDMAGRNVAITNQGNVFFIDWEKAQISMRQSTDPEKKYVLSHLDTKTLQRSLWLPPSNGGLGLFLGQDETKVWPVFREVFLDEYLVCREQYVDVGKHNNKLLAATIEELEVLEGALFQDMADNAKNLGALAMSKA